MSIDALFRDLSQLTQYRQSVAPARNNLCDSFLSELNSLTSTSANQKQSNPSPSQTDESNDSPETATSDPTQLTQLFQSLTATHQPCDPSVVEQFFAELASISEPSIPLTETT